MAYNFGRVREEYLLGMSVLDVEAKEDTGENDACGGEDSHGEEEGDGDHPGQHHLDDRVRRRVAVWK